MLLFENTLSVPIPDSFQPMTQEQAAGWYPYEQKPQILLKDKDHPRWCTFSHLREQKLTNKQVESAIAVICEVVTRLYPSGLLKAPETLSLADGVLGCFSFRSVGDEGDLHNVMYVFPLEHKMLLGTLCWPLEDQEAGAKLLQMLQAIKPETSYGKIGR